MTRLRRLTTGVCAAMLAASLGAPTALADVYVWTDDAGVKHVSNLPPPEGARGVSVTRSKPLDPAQEAALREAVRQAEVRALNERVQQLEVQAEHARREATQAIAAAAQRLATPAPAAPPYVIVVAQPPPAPAQPPPMGPCDYAWGNCGWSFWPGFYSPGYVVVNEGRHHHRHTHRPAHHHAPLRDPGHFTAPPAVHPYPFPIPKPTSWRK